MRTGLSIGPGGDKCDDLIGGRRSETGAEDGATWVENAATGCQA